MILKIKIAGPEDAELIADLSRKTFFETFAPVNTKENMDKFLDEQFTREKLIAEITEAGNIFLLAYSDNQPAGYARLRTGKTTTHFENQSNLEIARIYVVNSFIGAGVGKELMLKCIALARELKNEIIWLGVWEKNTRAISFYKKWGFEKVGEHDFVLGDDRQLDWIMKKQLL